MNSTVAVRNPGLRLAGSALSPLHPTRVLELDALRGLLTLFVVFSHFFVELPHGLGMFSVGWVAVIGFFVLSGYLVGGLIIDRKDAHNFLRVFYVRRFCRTVPTYLLVCAAVLMLTSLAGYLLPGTHVDDPLPTWSYFAFVQNAFVLLRESTGHPWLAPTWTLALEEQFYLAAPWLFLLVPRQRWMPVLVLVLLGGLVCRAVGVLSGTIGIAPLAILPTSVDVLSVGLILAVLVKSGHVDWARWSLLLRSAPILCFLATALLQRLDGGVVGPLFQIFGPLLIAVAAALFILMLVKGAPEAQRFRSPTLAFCGSISYGIYLTHLAVLGLLHGCILHAPPDLRSPVELAVTCAALPVTFAAAYLLTRFIEAPMMAWGRRARWR